MDVFIIKLYQPMFGLYLTRISWMDVNFQGCEGRRGDLSKGIVKLSLNITILTIQEADHFCVPLAPKIFLFYCSSVSFDDPMCHCLLLICILACFILKICDRFCESLIFFLQPLDPILLVVEYLGVPDGKLFSEVLFNIFQSFHLCPLLINNLGEYLAFPF